MSKRNKNIFHLLAAGSTEAIMVLTFTALTLLGLVVRKPLVALVVLNVGAFINFVVLLLITAWAVRTPAGWIIDSSARAVARWMYSHLRFRWLYFYTAADVTLAAIILLSAFGSLMELHHFHGADSLHVPIWVLAVVYGLVVSVAVQCVLTPLNNRFSRKA